MAGSDDVPRRDGDPAAVAADFAARHHLGGADFAKACEALAPAFALALAKAAEAPERWLELSRAFLAPAGEVRQARPNELVDAVFGGAALREAVVRQASAMSGVASNVVAAAMPQLATLGAEAMMRAASGNFAAAPGKPLPIDAFGPFAAEMMRRGANAVEAFSRPAGAPSPYAAVQAGNWFSNPFLDAFAAALRTNAAASPTAGSQATASAPDNPLLPFATLFDAFATGMRSNPSPAKPAEAPSRAPASPADLLDGFARSGQRFRDDYAKGMAALFERFPGKGSAAG